MRESRDEAIFEAYRNALGTMRFTNDAEACDWVRTHPASSFYTSPEFCQIVLSRMLKGKDCGLKGLRRDKFQELLRLYNIEKQKPKNSDKSMLHICRIIVDMPAPSYFLGRRSVSAIIVEQRRLFQERHARRWK